MDGLNSSIAKLVDRVIVVEQVLKSVKDSVCQIEKNGNSSHGKSKRKIPLRVIVYHPPMSGLLTYTNNIV